MTGTDLLLLALGLPVAVSLVLNGALSAAWCTGVLWAPALVYARWLRALDRAGGPVPAGRTHGLLPLSGRWVHYALMVLLFPAIVLGCLLVCTLPLTWVWILSGESGILRPLWIFLVLSAASAALSIRTLLLPVKARWWVRLFGLILPPVVWGLFYLYERSQTGGWRFDLYLAGPALFGNLIAQGLAVRHAWLRRAG